MKRTTVRIKRSKTYARHAWLPTGICLCIGMWLWAACGTTKSAMAPAKQDYGHFAKERVDSIKDIDRAEDLFMEALKSRTLEKNDTALEQFGLLAAADNLGGTPHFELSRLWLEKRDLPKALSEIKKATQKDALNKWFQVQMADILIYSGKYLEAADIYKRLSDRHSTADDFKEREARLLMAAGKYREALSVTDDIARLSGDDDESNLVLRYELHLYLNDVDAAAAEMRKLMHYYPYEPKYAVQLAELYENNDRPQEAAQALQEADSRFPGSGVVQLAMIKQAVQQKDTLAIKENTRKVLSNREIPMEYRISLLLPIIQARDSIPSYYYEWGVDNLKAMADMSPPEFDPCYLYAEVLMSEKADSAAERYLLRSLEADSSKTFVWTQLAIVKMWQMDWGGMLRYVEAAQQKTPDDARMYYLGGIAYLQIKDYGKAIGQLNKAMEADFPEGEKGHLEILSMLGDAYNGKKEYAASDSCYRKVLSVDPDNLPVLNNFSYYLSLRGAHLQEAERMSARTLEFEPEESTYLDTYAWVLYKMGKYKEAETYLLKAIEFIGDRDDGAIWEHLGDVQFKIGEKEKAVASWEKALQKNKDSKELKRKIKERKLQDE